MQDADETLAVARLPGLDLTIQHRRVDGLAEEMVLTLRTGPGSDSLEQFLRAANPVFAWMHLVQAAWAPWIGMMAAFAPPPRLPRD